MAETFSNWNTECKPKAIVWLQLSLCWEVAFRSIASYDQNYQNSSQLRISYAISLFCQYNSQCIKRWNIV